MAWGGINLQTTVLSAYLAATRRFNMKTITVHW